MACRGDISAQPSWVTEECWGYRGRRDQAGTLREKPATTVRGNARLLSARNCPHPPPRGGGVAPTRSPSRDRNAHIPVCDQALDRADDPYDRGFAIARGVALAR